MLRTGFGGVALQAQMTPPDTPLSSQDTADSLPAQALFHNYLRALHHFDPSTTLPQNESDNSLMTAVIKPGDLILVHSVHANGWADGTVLTTGDRGWLPTNYCEAYDHPYLRNLLNAMTQFWDLLGANEEANLSNFVRQDYIRGLIAGVRYLLEHADCLHRAASLVQENTGIRRMRKALLADLSTLVQIARSLQETINEPFAAEIIHYLLDDLVAKAFKVVTRAVGFVDMWTKETAEGRLKAYRQSIAPIPGVTPWEAPDLIIDTHAAGLSDQRHLVDSAKFLPPDTPAQQEQQATAGADAETCRSGEHHTASVAAFAKRQSSLTPRSLGVDSEQDWHGTLASERLARVHDLCISNIGAFIGHRLHLRPSSELVETTERLVKACKSMLAIVDDVYSHDPQRTASVLQARSDFQSKLEDLMQATKDVFDSSALEEGEVVMLPDQSNHLITVGTSLIRSSGDCVARTRGLIEQIGDFELAKRPSSASAQDQHQATLPRSPSKAGQHESPRRKRLSFRRRLSRKSLPPTPQVRQRASTITDTFDFASPSAADLSSTGTSDLSHVEKTLPLAPPMDSLAKSSQRPASIGAGLKNGRSSQLVDVASPSRKDSVGMSIAGSTETFRSSVRNSGLTGVSDASTRATTPDRLRESKIPDPALLNSFGSISSFRSGTSDVEAETERQLLQKTYANELTFNREGHVSGGSLPALVEKLTTHDTAPDPHFVTAFYITFRMFTTPRELAQVLIARFDYIGDSKSVGTPARLRIYNVFKGWLETYWNAEADRDALGEIRYFALHRLQPHLPSAGERLAALTRKLSNAYHDGTIHNPLVSGVGKTSLSIHPSSGKPVSPPSISSRQLQAVRSDLSGAHQYSIAEVEAEEIARQLTLMASAIFCEIRPEELLSLEWNKKGSSSAPNVRRMCAMNNDLAHVVAETILEPEDAKKRALVIKHWVKVAAACLELSNYDSLMAIMCTLNSSVVQRLKRTWEQVAKKTKGQIEDLNAVIDIKKNHASLRKRLETPVAPCIPFLGIYLTDLTFLDVGNSKKRDLPGAPAGESTAVINFDKYQRMARVVSHLQKYQVPFKQIPVPELQAWLEKHLHRMSTMQDEMVTRFHRRSLLIEPKQERPPMIITGGKKDNEAVSNEERPKTATKERFESFLRSNTFSFKAHDMPAPVASTEKQV